MSTETTTAPEAKTWCDCGHWTTEATTRHARCDYCYRNCPALRRCQGKGGRS